LAVLSWRALRAAWAQVCELEVAQLELPPLHVGPPRAFVHDGLDGYYVRQLVPGGRIGWYREDTGEPVSESLDRQLGLRLALAYVGTD
jgi:hypothetical protein